MKHPLSTAQAPLAQSLVSGLEQALEELSQAAPSGGTVDTSGLLPNTGPATFTGSLQVGSLQTGDCTVSGALRVQDIDVLALAQGKQTQLTQTSPLTVARVTASAIEAGGATPSEATASAFTDLEELDLMVNSIRGRPAGDLVLEGSSGPVLRIPPAGGASIAGRLTSSGGVTITGGGQGRNGTGASLRITGTGDLVYITSALYFGGNGVDLHSFELSWLGYAHFMRPNANAGTAWTQTMGISSAGY